MYITHNKDFNIHTNIKEYFDYINPLPIPLFWHKTSTEKCTIIALYGRSLLPCKLRFPSHAVLPSACLISSKLNHWTKPDLRDHHIALLNNNLRALKKLQPKFAFIFPLNPPAPSQCIVQRSADEGTGSEAYGKTGFVPGLLLQGAYLSDDQIFYGLLWQSSKQARISFCLSGLKY